MPRKPLPLDKHHKALLSLVKHGETEGLTLLEIGEKIGIDYPQGVINKFRQLEARGLLRKSEQDGWIATDAEIPPVFHFPVLGMAQCGNLATCELKDIAQTELLPFPTKGIAVKTADALSRFFFVLARGNSMKPAINDGDLVLVRSQASATGNEMALLLHNGNPKIKRVSTVGNQLVLVSINPEHEPLEVAGEDEVKVKGVVVKIVSNPQ